MTTEGTVTVASQPAETTEPIVSVQAAYDRVANPNKVHDDAQQVEAEKKSEPKADPAAATVDVSTADLPKEPAFDPEQFKTVMAQVSRIPELEKQLRDAGGRYGALKQTLEQLQQRIAAPASGDPVDVDDMLKGIKEEFGEEGLYQSLKTAFSKLAAGKTIDPAAIEKMVSDRIKADRQAETDEAMQLLTDAHPTWLEDRKTPEFKEWVESLPEKERNRFTRSQDPFYVADKLDDFKAWKAKKAEPPAEKDPPADQKPPAEKDPPADQKPPAEKDPPADQKPPAEKSAPAAPMKKPDPAPSKRLTSAVLPTHGTKPKTSGEDDKASQVRAAYERVSGARMR